MSDGSPAAAGQTGTRPDFLVILGLIPPVSVEDVKQAYLDKAKAAHPDRGGSTEEFVRLQNAFEQATEYAKFKAGRMQWLSQWVEQYAAQEQIVNEVRALGGSVDVESCDWLVQSIGSDFATVLDRIHGIKLSGPLVDDAALVNLRSHRRMLTGLKRLELVNTNITSVGLGQLDCARKPARARSDWLTRQRPCRARSGE